MKTEMHKIFNLKGFFTLKNKIANKYVYKIESSSNIVLHNIHMCWLRSVYAKTAPSIPVYLNKDINNKNNDCYGIIEKVFDSYPTELKVENNEEDYNIEENNKLKLTIMVPKQDVMQYFFQWQRYRKYWWSSITTTPSLFALNEMKYGSSIVDTQVVAKFKHGEKVVEEVSINTDQISGTMARLTCCMSLETALCTLMLEGVTNQTSNGYLRLHNKIAPYKISFVLNCKDEKNMKTLKELATHICSKLSSKQISTCLPSFSLPLQAQIEENLLMGVSYTAILSDASLSNGIFHLLNSSTMLKEQIHLADFENYAVLLCSK